MGSNYPPLPVCTLGALGIFGSFGNFGVVGDSKPDEDVFVFFVVVGRLVVTCLDLVGGVSTITLPYSTQSLCFYIPVHFSIRKFQLIYHKHHCLILFGAITHIITLAYGISKAFEHESWFWILIFQVYYTMFTLSAVDFFAACVGEIEDYVNETELESSSPIVVVREPVHLRFNIPSWFTVADVMDYQAALQG
ncbi:hypothetical protein GCK72_011347 [Caenorhabditis remanei]|uniref:Uncharacterized protein n=1 Tax=Caenorhabditis remanei TaxID=31234 RepID=A0A6A5H9J9_CAERE|nr:hypothetical protein GCK72_011347 [Caenorhabditis remanei]KAF1763082.1 hypothetical protein GCK72_011347 [Caenorhabditis remanei]